MQEINGDLWSIDCDARCITTNGTITKDGKNVMGAGCAKQAADRYPMLPQEYAYDIHHTGNHTYVYYYEDEALVMLPVKHNVREKADLVLIKRSLIQLVGIANLLKWEKVLIPQPGCGLGGLDWKKVKPEIESILDDRFVIVDYAK